MFVQLSKFIKNTELYTYDKWILCYFNFASIKLFKT